MLDVKETLKPQVLTYNIWEWSIIIREDVGGLRDLVHPLHTLLVQEFHEVKNIHDIILFPNNGFCSKPESLSKCDIKCHILCIIVRDVMHGLL